MRFSALVAALALSVCYAAAIADLVHDRRFSVALSRGLLFGAGLYLVNFYVVSGLFPALAEARGGLPFMSHSLFGVLSALFYKALSGEGRGV
ncbi:MAG: hypothetical protein HY549_01835 [Elusimicrobia bacterium]|nr:hypothetical protein [Elusimicrobiota bacterium]